MKIATMEILIFTQVLMKYLIDFSKWYVDYKKSTTINVLKYFFFISKCMQLLLIKYYKMLIINCIYKINKYKILLLIIIEIIFSNIIFYVEFCFIKNEIFENYLWVIWTLIRFFDNFNIFYSITIIIDNNKTLLLIIFRIFEKINYQINYIFCI